MNVLCTHEPLSPAVQRCCDARNRMIELDRNSWDDNTIEIPKDINTNHRALAKFQVDALQLLSGRDPSLAYRSNMPELNGRRSIKEYIACVMHGMAIGAIKQEEGRNMLYGARTAALALDKRTRTKKQPEKKIPGAHFTEQELFDAATELFRSEKRAEKDALKPGLNMV